MRSISTAEKLMLREKVIGTTITHFSWSGIIASLRKQAIHYVIVEMEHNFFDWRDTEALLRACNEAQLTAIVRVPDISYHDISKALDLGADGVLIPRIESLSQLERVIEFVRLPPRGKKGVGGYDFSRKSALEKISGYNEEKMIWIQVESPAAIDVLEQMLETKEVAAAIVGPTDLSVAMGIPLQFQHPELTTAISRVVDICNRQQTSCGMFMSGKPEDTRHWLQQGMNVVWSGTDYGFFQAGYNAWFQKMRELL